MSRKFFKTIVLTSSLLVSSSPQQVPSWTLQLDIYNTLQSPLPSKTLTDTITTTQENIQEIFSDTVTNETITEKRNDTTVLVMSHKTLEPIIEQPFSGDISTVGSEKNNTSDKAIASASISQKDTSPILSQSKKGNLWPSEVMMEIKEKETTSKEFKKSNNKLYFSRVVDSIVSPTSKVNFDVEYMKKEIHTLLDHCYRIENKRLIFIPPTQEKKEIITSLMDSIRQHIKDNNNIFVKIFLWKKALRNFITEEIDTIYDILVEENKLQYTWWEEQFKQDFHAIIDIYK